MKPGAPKYATKRNPQNPTFGPRAALVAAKVLGTPFMPWQRLVSDVALEIDPDNPGAWRYDDVIVTVPRQAGKTAEVRAVSVDRLLAYRNHVIMMTAQTGKAARKRWDQIVAAVDPESHPTVWKKMASRGSESLQHRRSGSILSPFPPTETDGHGDSLHMVTIDEAWAFDEAQGMALDAAVNPTMLTILDSQKWTVSTKGTAKSAYLNKRIEEGRASLDDPTSRIAYFEWSADEALAEADPYSRDTLAFHPAIGHTQTYEKIIRLGAKEHISTWRRSYLNLDDPTGASAPIDLAIWDDLIEEIELPGPSVLTIGYDVALDLSAASIYVAWKDSADQVHASLLVTKPGHAWLVPALVALDQQGYTTRVADPTGPTQTVLEDLDGRGYTTKALTTREYAAACQWLVTACDSGTFNHDGATQTRDALEVTASRFMGGALAWDPRKSGGPIDTLRALTVAAHAASTVRSTGLIF